MVKRGISKFLVQYLTKGRLPMEKNNNWQSLLIVFFLSAISCTTSTKINNEEVVSLTIQDLPHFDKVLSTCDGEGECESTYRCYSKYLKKLYYGGHYNGKAYFNGRIDDKTGVDYELLANCALLLSREGDVKAHRDLLLFYKNEHRYATVGNKEFVAYSSKSFYYDVLSKMRGPDVLDVILLLSNDSVCDDGGHGDDTNNRSLNFLKSILPEVIDNIDGQSPNDWVWQRDQYTIAFVDKGVKYGGCREIELELYKYKLKEAQKNNLIDFKKYDGKIY